MYIIVKIKREYIIKKVKILRKDTDILILRDLNSKNVYKRDKDKVIYNYNTAKIVAQERQMILDYKFKNKINGKWECSCCGTKYTDIHKITVDHIEPLSLYKTDIRADINIWKKIWNEDNFSIKCKRCNKAKSNIHYKTDEYLERISRRKNNKNLRFASCGRSQKIGLWIRTSKKARRKFSQKEIYSCAIRDSRILNMKSILR